MNERRIVIGYDTPFRRRVETRVRDLRTWALNALDADVRVLVPPGSPEEVGTIYSTGVDRVWTAADLLNFASEKTLTDALEFFIKESLAMHFPDDPELLDTPDLIERWPPPKGHPYAPFGPSPLNLTEQPWNALDLAEHTWKAAWHAWWQVARLAVLRGAKAPPRLTIVRSDSGSPANPFLSSWTPEDVSPKDVLEWAGDHGWMRLDPVWANLMVNPTMGVLWWAWHRLQKRRPAAWGTISAPVGTTTLGTLSQLQAPGRSAFGGSEPRQLPDRIEVTFREKTSVQLTLEFGAVGGVLQALQQQHGPTTVRETLILFVLAWGAEVHQDQAWWVWPGEALELAGLKVSKENLQRWWSVIDTLERTVLEVVEGGRTVRAAVCQVTATTGLCGGKTPVQLKMHPYLYRDLTGPDGRPGRSWVAMPRELLKAPIGGAGLPSHLTALIIGRQFYAVRCRQKKSREELQRTDLEIRIRAARLADYHGLIANRPRDRNRITSTLDRTMNALREAGCVADFRWDGGEQDPLDAVLVATPGDATLAAFQGNYPRPPAYVPATGAALRRFMDEADYTAAELGEELGVTAENVRKACQRYRNLPLPDGWRTRLVRWRRGGA